MTRSTRNVLAIAAAIASCACAPARAHELWLEPGTHAPASAEPYAVEARIGHPFDGESMPRDEGLVRGFDVIDATGRRGIPGTAGQSPAGWARAQTPGVAVIAYDGRHRVIELDADSFDLHLAEHGHGDLVARRAANGREDAPVVEAYARCAKALVAVDADHGTGHDRRAGLAHELVPLDDPFSRGDGAPLRVLVLLDGRALPGALVRAWHEDDADRVVERRTDARGVAVLPVRSPGRWILSSVHVRPAMPELDAEWESLWASLSFETFDLENRHAAATSVGHSAGSNDP